MSHHYLHASTLLLGALALAGAAAAQDVERVSLATHAQKEPAASSDAAPRNGGDPAMNRAELKHRHRTRQQGPGTGDQGASSAGAAEGAGEHQSASVDATTRAEQRAAKKEAKRARKAAKQAARQQAPARTERDAAGQSQSGGSDEQRMLARERRAERREGAGGAGRHRGAPGAAP